MSQQPAANQPNDITATTAKDKLMNTDDSKPTTPETQASTAGRGDPQDRGGGGPLPAPRGATTRGRLLPGYGHSMPSPMECPCDIDAAVRELGNGPLTITEAQQLFVPDSGYLDTATYGLLSYPTIMAISKGLMDWASGKATPKGHHLEVTEARGTFGRLVQVPASHVAVRATTAEFVAVIADAVPEGTTVLISEKEFTSAWGPFSVRCEQGRYRVRFVPLDRLADEMTDDVSLVVVSAAQSLDGAVADLNAIEDAAKEHGAWTMIDATQSIGWQPLNANHYTFLICHSYKFLGVPRGATFMAISPDMARELPAIGANWYSGEDIWNSLYGPSLILASDARRHDASPAWLSWLGAVPALKLIEQVGVEAINRHDVGLANAFREGMRIPIPRVASPIVSVRGIPDAEQRLDGQGLRASVRGDGVRLAFHLYNDQEDVQKALRALGSRRA
ncbi:aminotransferase class V-fold PLP-dependent enzyme [Streptomyces sp. NPDC006658]|uniref:aminotransferase class V-fold PLP-dependent enzyme n=1 Tax=Streptomyces sp. NPDC006658 TaxID=3156900 RepID=UPI0033E96B0F